jgi:hypothetical protein
MIKGRTVYHCKGGHRGKPIKTHATREKALAQHRAIMAQKSAMKKKIKSLGG